MKEAKNWLVRERLSDDLVSQLLINRGLLSAAAQQSFLNPESPEKLSSRADLTSLSDQELGAAILAIKSAIEKGREIIVHGDYDVDGLCATAILWQTIRRDLGYPNCHFFIPNRFDHGYGLSMESIDSIIQNPNLKSQNEKGRILLITVDCGITASSAVEYAKEKGFEVLIVDHHTPPAQLPDCLILWTDKMCASGLAWTLSYKLQVTDPSRYIDLAAVATIADLQPLTGFNRSLVRFGLAALNRTENLGLRALLKAAGIEGRLIGTFEVGWVIAPRLNAAGRLESALGSLKLLTTADPEEALVLALDLNRLNSERQQLTRSMVELAIGQIRESLFLTPNATVNVVIHEQFHEGIIGLVAGKLVQEYGRPAVVISRGREFSKASARSLNGFNIVEFLRSLGDHFEDIGGHAGAAGFTIRTEKIENLITAISQQQSAISLPESQLTIDAEVKFEQLNLELLGKIKKLEPYGLGNPEPVFLLKEVRVIEARPVGFQNQHLKLKVINDPASTETSTGRPRSNDGATIDCIGFDLGSRLGEVPVGAVIDLVFYLTEDAYNGYRKLSLKLKDFKKSNQD